jgi:hypothetical protein
MIYRWRALLAFALMWLLYQIAEGVGERWLHSFPVQAGLTVACVVVAGPLSRWLGYRGYPAYALAGGNGLRWWLPGGLLFAVLAKFAATWLGLRLGIYAPDASTPAMGGVVLLAALPMLLLSTFVPSLAEDILTRGFWYRAAGVRWRGGVVFVLASSAIYVLNHIYRLSNGPLEWLTLFYFGPAYATALAHRQPVGRGGLALGLESGQPAGRCRDARVGHRHACGARPFHRCTPADVATGAGGVEETHGPTSGRRTPVIRTAACASRSG